MYIPSLRRIRKLSATDSQDPVMGQDVIYDDNEGWMQKISPVRYPYKYEILEGLLNQSNKYLDNLKFKEAKYLYKKVGDFQVYKFKERISALKKKHKELKKKQK